MLTAAFLINRTPTPVLGNKSPFELLYKAHVDYSLLKVFGCLAFASTYSVPSLILEQEFVFSLVIQWA